MVRAPKPPLPMQSHGVGGRVFDVRTLGPLVEPLWLGSRMIPERVMIWQQSDLLECDVWRQLKLNIKHQSINMKDMFISVRFSIFSVFVNSDSDQQWIFFNSYLPHEMLQICFGHHRHELQMMTFLRSDTLAAIL